MSPEQLAALLEEHLAGATHAVVLEDGMVLFDLRSARYSITADAGRCVLHLWSEERNIVRRVLAAEHKGGVLRLEAHRFGHAKPVEIEIVRDGQREPPSVRKSARKAYEQRLGRVLAREFPLHKLDRLTTAMDLERSFGPVYTRGLLRRGTSAWAVLGVAADEQQPLIDAAATAGVLWLDACRREPHARAYVEGLIVVAPSGRTAMLRERLAHLDRDMAKWRLLELHADDTVSEADTADRGNVITRLVHAPDDQAARERFAMSTKRVRAIVPEADVVVISPAEVGYRLHGLEFARARMTAGSGFSSRQEITFGVGANETTLNDDTEALFASLMERVRESRRSGGERNALWRMQPERWLESLVMRDVEALDSRLDPGCVYSQVPAFAAGDRAMIDVLTTTRDGRLAVLELKADEDIHLPMQAVDYWARVVWHHQRGEFQRYGYFQGRELSPDPPLLLMVAPALHVHPATDTLLRYLDPAIDCEIIAVDEHWREGLRVVFRKRRSVAALISS